MKDRDEALENCDSVLIRRLRDAGHDVQRVADLSPGADDSDIVRIAMRQDRVLLTHDTDFGLLAERSETLPPAVVSMRLHPLKAAARAELVVTALAAIGECSRGKFYVIEPGSVRERPFGMAG